MRGSQARPNAGAHALSHKASQDNPAASEEHHRASRRPASPMKTKPNDPQSGHTLAPSAPLNSLKRAHDEISGGNTQPLSPHTSPNPPPKRTKPTTANNPLDKAAPLADRMRPRTLSEVHGQPLVAPGGLLHSLTTTSSSIPSMILWGGPGTGKTTIARLIAKTATTRFVEINSTSTGVGECKKLFQEARNELSLTGRKTIIFCDEIHRFTKAQQDVFLAPVEAGVITLIGATTENPSFKIINALLSRCQTFTLKPLKEEDIVQILKRALTVELEDKQEFAEQHLSRELLSDREPLAPPTSHLITPDLLQYLATISQHDARTALNLLSTTLSLLKSNPALTFEALKSSLTRTTLLYDRNGDAHYDHISALHKSIRGSSPDAALFYLSRMIASGEDPLYIARRLIVIASEDIGLADNNMLTLAVNAHSAVEKVGLPEARINLGHCVTALALSKKSTRAYRALGAAGRVVKGDGASLAVPVHLRNAPTRLMRELGYGKEYKYNPDYRDGCVLQEYLPNELEGRKFLEENDLGDKIDEELRAKDPAGIRKEYDDKDNSELQLERTRREKDEMGNAAVRGQKIAEREPERLIAPDSDSDDDAAHSEKGIDSGSQNGVVNARKDTAVPDKIVTLDAEEETNEAREARESRKWDQKQWQIHKDKLFINGKDEWGISFPDPGEPPQKEVGRELEEVGKKRRLREKGKEEKERKESEAKQPPRNPPYQSRADWQTSALGPDNASPTPYHPTTTEQQHERTPPSVNEARACVQSHGLLNREAPSKASHPSSGKKSRANTVTQPQQGKKGSSNQSRERERAEIGFPYPPEWTLLSNELECHQKRREAMARAEVFEDRQTRPPGEGQTAPPGLGNRNNVIQVHHLSRNSSQIHLPPLQQPQPQTHSLPQTPQLHTTNGTASSPYNYPQPQPQSHWNSNNNLSYNPPPISAPSPSQNLHNPNQQSPHKPKTPTLPPFSAISSTENPGPRRYSRVAPGADGGVNGVGGAVERLREGERDEIGNGNGDGKQNAEERLMVEGEDIGLSD
ncbi:MAG: hypothetical protein M1831_002279 [Alyxoria varia]|nr:MAG: hypothetical protein M1831_002279 [Alyxoria varia]